jgi:hypothetical protein
MSAQHPPIDDPELGMLTQAESIFDDGTVAVHDWYAGRIDDGDAQIELIIDGPEVDDVRARLPRLKTAVADLADVRRAASKAVIAHFSEIEPEQYELDEGAADLRLEAIEASADGEIVLHFVDICGAHFPDGYWPAAHLGPDNAVTAVSVES